MAEQPALEVNKMAQPSVNQPQSGTYGEGAALQRLQDALPKAVPPPGLPQPQGVPISTEPARPTSPQREGRPPSGAALPPGVPSPILAPTDQPGVPVSTPLSSSTPALQPTAQQSRLAILDALAESPGVSPATRDWARMVRSVLLGA